MSKEKNDKIKKVTQRNWHIFDASEESFGRMASKISLLLRGKNKTSYTSHIDGGDYVVVINADNLKYTGDKSEGKIYYSHSWYIGGLKQITLGNQIKKDSRAVIKKAVYGMLPKNKLRDKMIKRLRIYKDKDYLEKDRFK